MSSTGLRPYLEKLEMSGQQKFIRKLKEELKQYYPIQENQKILFPFERIFFIAQPKEE